MTSYPELALSVARLVEQKQAQYGDSFGRGGAILRTLYPAGIRPEALEQALTVVRVIDKLFRIATAAGRPDAGGENPWQDIAGYALLELGRAAGEEGRSER
jgi:hypothetical protein